MSNPVCKEEIIWNQPACNYSPENRKWITFRLQSEYFATEFEFFFAVHVTQPWWEIEFIFGKKTSECRLSLMSLYLQLYLTVADITEKYYFKIHCIFKFHNLLYESDHDHELFCISTTVSVWFWKLCRIIIRLVHKLQWEFDMYLSSRYIHNLKYWRN